MDVDSELPALQPPTEIDGNRWYDVPPADALARHLTDRFGRGPVWQVTRLLGAAYAYRTAGGETIVAKYYSLKTRFDVHRHATCERTAIERARRVVGDAVVEVLDQFRGVLIMPYVTGLSLQSAVAVRRNHAGTLSDQLAAIATVLAKLHGKTTQAERLLDFTPAAAYGRQVVRELSDYGVLEGDPLTRRALEELISRWGDRPRMHDFVPALVHGDATTGNFLFPANDRVIVLDWERSQLGDPAQDLGRLAAEVTHSIVQHGGNVAEALRLIDDFTAAYCAALPVGWSADALCKRAPYYRAISSLRIARNSWSPRSRRALLVGQALALLSTE
jgi:aminoglycoside phosphotransferase (APT) family kinase protein